MTTAGAVSARATAAAKRPRIAIFEPYIFDSMFGNMRYIMTIFKFLDRRRFDLVLISPVAGRFLDEISALGGTWRTLLAPAPLRRYGGLIPGAGPAGKIVAVACLAWYSIRLVAHFVRHRIDIVQCHDLRAALTAGLAAKIAGCRLIWYVKGELDRPLLDRFCLAIADRVLFQGETNMRRLDPETLRKHRHKVEILANGIDLEELFEAERRDHGALAEELRLSARNVNIVFVGQIMAAKGLGELIDAMAVVQQAAPDTALYIVGDHCIEEYRGYRTELEAMIRDRGLANVTLTGFRRDVHDIVSLMDIFVLPSHAEGVPKSIIEAMALAKPVVTTPVGSVPDLIEDGVTGLLVGARDSVALADRLTILVRDPDLRTRLGRAARQSAVANCSIIDNISGLERLYDGMCPSPAA